jgi:GTP-binding protein
VLVAANKVDTARDEKNADEFAELGFEKVFPVSAIHGGGIEDLMQTAVALLPEVSSQRSVVSSKEPSAEAKATDHELLTTDRPALKLAIVGRPNVGKSSIINALTKSERVIVSPIPGTTRDAIDVPFEVKRAGDGGVATTEKYILIDTAGMRKARRVDDSIEFFSVQRAEDSIARSDITVLVLDAEAGITEQDKKVADRIVEERKACIVVVNKWDLMAESVRKAREEEIERRRRKDRHSPELMTTLGEFGQWVQQHLFFLDYAPVIFTSAHSGFNLERLLEAVRYVAAQLRQEIPTAILNRTLQDAVERRQPVSSHGQRLKFFYATQVAQAPPTFLLFVNREALFSSAYKRYLADQMRGAFGYEGCPIILVPKARPKTIEPVRKPRPGRRPQGTERGRKMRAERR